MTQQRTVDLFVLRRCAVWNNSKFAWWLGHYMLGILATVAPITSAVHPKWLSEGWRSGLDVTGAVCGALLTFLIPARIAKTFGAAWRKLDLAIMSYRLDATVTEAELLKAIKEGESLLDTIEAV